MEFIADLHIHSRFSRATAKTLDLEHLQIAAQQKGIGLVATGDFTHPGWFEEIRDKLVPTEGGLLRLRDDIADGCDRRVPEACRGEVRFILATEISNIYKKEKKTRKNHNLVYLPDLEGAQKFTQRLERIGNIRSDGRPILGLDAHDLLEIVLETDESAFLVPAHIWTPWFSVLGSKSGFDSIEACYGDLTPHIFALETGLSSDPLMNRRVSILDRYTLVSNSDAHSPAKLGREANLFDTELSYEAIRSALKDRDPRRFLGTFEFYPEEGKYHVDGHRKCGVRLLPEQTREYRGICPVCAKPMTLGVLYRVEELADRPSGRPIDHIPFFHLIPLNEILAEIFGVGPNSKQVARTYQKLLEKIGPELSILHFQEKTAIDRGGVPLLSEAIRRMRHNEISLSPGFDGEFGKIRIFDSRERQTLADQKSLFTSGTDIRRHPPSGITAGNRTLSEEMDLAGGGIQDVSKESFAKPSARPVAPAEQTPLFAASAPEPILSGLNPEQMEAVKHPDGPLLIIAGPGTGKTRTLTYRIAHLIRTRSAAPAEILALTFTQKAAKEMGLRLGDLLDRQVELPLTATFHAFCLRVLSEESGRPLQVVDEQQRRAVLFDAIEMARCDGCPPAPRVSPETLMKRIVLAKQQMIAPEDPLDSVCPLSDQPQLRAVYRHYQRLLDIENCFDYEDLIFRTVRLLEEDPDFLQRCRKRFRYVMVDEYQDINHGQYRIVRALAGHPASGLFAIGDPNQSIYGFRGSDAVYFNRFVKDFSGARIIHLRRNYRSCATILSAAAQVIQKSHGVRSADRMYSDISGDRTVGFMEAASERAEAVAIGKVIEEMVGGFDFQVFNSGSSGGSGPSSEKSFGDFAVLYRTHQQGVVIAEAFAKAGIPCQLARPIRRCQGRGVAVLLALLRILSGRCVYSDLETVRDLIAPRIAPATFAIFKTWGYRCGFSLKKALFQASRLPIAEMSGRRQKRLCEAIAQLSQLEKKTEALSLGERITYLVSNSNLTKFSERSENVTFIQQVTRMIDIADGCKDDISRFFEALALQTDTDAYERKAERVALMTIHASKGLEFPVVFIAGCENGLIPYLRDGEAADLEEERRLFYVAMTRAERHLYFTFARKRGLRGRSQQREVSPFVADIETNLIHRQAKGYLKRHPKAQVQLSLFG